MKIDLSLFLKFLDKQLITKDGDDADWQAFASKLIPELENYFARTDLSFIRAITFYWDHEDGDDAVVIDADNNTRPFADGPIDPYRLASWPDFLETPSDEDHHIFTEVLVYLCAEVLLQNATLLTKQEEYWCIFAVPGHDETPRSVFRSDQPVPSIFDEGGELRSRTVEERVEKIDLDGNAIADLWPKVHSAGDSMNLLGKSDDFFLHYFKLSKEEQAERKAELDNLVNALAANKERLSFESWEDMYEKIVSKAVCCALDDMNLLERIIKDLIPEYASFSPMAFNVACAFAKHDNKDDMISWATYAIELGHDPDTFRKDNDFASYLNDEDFLACLEKASISVEALTKQLGEAIKDFDLEKVETLIDVGADVNGEHGWDSILHTAVSASTWNKQKKPNKTPIIRALLKAGATLEDHSWPWYSFLNDLDVLELVLEHGAPANEKLLESCVEKEAIETIDWLVQRGIDLKECDPMVLWSACRHHEKRETFDRLIKAAVDFSARDEYGQGALHQCSGNSVLLEAFLNQGEDINAVNNRGEHIISRALFNDTSDFVQAAIKHGANLNHVDNLGNSLVYGAVEDGAKDCFAILLEAGAPIDTANNKGRTPLHMAVETNRLPMAKALLDAGASKDARDNEGKRAVDLAEGTQMRALLT